LVKKENRRKGIKAFDFEDFKKVANLIERGTHLTAKGLEEIRRIKSIINSLF